MEILELNSKSPINAIAGIVKSFQRLPGCRLVTMWVANSSISEVDLLLQSAARTGMPTQLRGRDIRAAVGFDLRRLDYRLVSELSIDVISDVGRFIGLGLSRGGTILVALPIRTSIAHLVVLLFIDASEFDITNGWHEHLINGGRCSRVAARTITHHFGELNDLVRQDVWRWVCDRVTKTSFLENLASLSHKRVGCEEVDVYLLNSAQRRLVCVTSTSDSQIAPKNGFARDDVAIVSKAWRRMQPVIQQTVHPCRHNRSTADMLPCNGMAIPITYGNDLLGVIMFTNKQGYDWISNRFTALDIFMARKIAGEAAPHLLAYRRIDRQDIAARRLVHEINAPLALATYASDRLFNLVGQLEGEVMEDCLSCARDLKNYINLLPMLVTNIDLAAGKHRPLEPVFKRSSLHRDVLLPALNALPARLSEMGFSANNILIARNDSLPPLFLDKRLFLQTVINILDNCVKYATSDPNSFRIEVSCEMRDDGYRVVVRDWGIGIASPEREDIFEDGTRGSNGLNTRSGQGLGLWVCRRIVEAHGGSIEFTSLFHPTELSIILPTALAHYPPNISMGLVVE